MIAAGGPVVLHNRCGALLCGQPLGCLLLIRVGEVYDERLQFVSRQDAMRLDEFHDEGDVSRAWLVWSRAAETALVDAYQFSGGPIPGRGLVLGRGGCFVPGCQTWWSQGSEGS